MRHWGHIAVHRGTAEVVRALPEAVRALAAGSVVLVYPEGRIGLDPHLWPERGRTGVAHLALTTNATVVPVAQWGSHEVVPYSAPRGLLRTLPRTIRRRPVVPGHPRRATDRIVAAITRELARLRVDEPGRPHHVDPTRPARPRPRPHKHRSTGSVEGDAPAPGSGDAQIRPTDAATG